MNSYSLLYLLPSLSLFLLALAGSQLSVWLHTDENVLLKLPSTWAESESGLSAKFFMTGKTLPGFWLTNSPAVIWEVNIQNLSSLAFISFYFFFPQIYF